MKKMKDSGIEWIGQIPEDWELTTYRRVFNRRKEYDDKDKQVLSLTIQGVKEKNESYGKMAEDFTGHQIVKKNDLVFTPRDFDATPILSGIAPCDGCISNLYFVLYPHDTSKTYIPFYNYFMWGVKWGGDIWRKLSYGMRFSYNFQQFGALPTVIPPMDIQIHIADFLDEKCGKIDRYIEKQQQVIEKLKAYKQSVITEAVTKGLDPNVPMKDSGIEWIGRIPENWNISKMKYLGKFINGYAFPSSSFQSSGTRVLKIANIQPMKISWEDESFVDEKYEALADYIVEKGDLVFALTRPIINGGIKTAIADFEYIALLNQRNAMFKGGKGITKQWQFYLMQNDLFVQEFAKYIDGTGQQPNISTKEISDIAIPLPPINIQDRITNYLNDKCSHIDRVIEVAQKTIIRMVEYKKSLIYEAVTGKLEV